eukprot:1827003-Ditylum_brightwellii.AAC.1
MHPSPVQQPCTIKNKKEQYPPSSPVSSNQTKKEDLIQQQQICNILQETVIMKPEIAVSDSILDAIFHPMKTNASQVTSLLQTQQPASATDCAIAIDIIAMATKTTATAKTATITKLQQLP